MGTATLDFRSHVLAPEVKLSLRVNRGLTHQQGWRGSLADISKHKSSLPSESLHTRTFDSDLQSC
jgi:hypothetical protein